MIDSDFQYVAFPGPTHHALREWQKAHMQLGERHRAYQQARDSADTISTTRAAILLAAAYDEERGFYERYEELVLEDLAQEINAMRTGVGRD